MAYSGISLLDFSKWQLLLCIGSDKYLLIIFPVINEIYFLGCEVTDHAKYENCVKNSKDFLLKVKDMFMETKKNYGYNVKISVLLIKICIKCTENFFGSVSDLKLYYKMYNFHAEASEQL